MISGTLPEKKTPRTVFLPVELNFTQRKTYRKTVLGAFFSDTVPEIGSNWVPLSLVAKSIEPSEFTDFSNQ